MSAKISTRVFVEIILADGRVLGAFDVGRIDGSDSLAVWFRGHEFDDEGRPRRTFGPPSFVLSPFAWIAWRELKDPVPANPQPQGEPR